MRVSNRIIPPSDEPCALNVKTRTLWWKIEVPLLKVPLKIRLRSVIFDYIRSCYRTSRRPLFGGPHLALPETRKAKRQDLARYTSSVDKQRSGGPAIRERHRSSQCPGEMLARNLTYTRLPSFHLTRCSKSQGKHIININVVVV